MQAVTEVTTAPVEGSFELLDTTKSALIELRGLAAQKYGEARRSKCIDVRLQADFTLMGPNGRMITLPAGTNGTFYQPSFVAHQPTPEGADEPGLVFYKPHHANRKSRKTPSPRLNGPVALCTFALTGGDAVTVMTDGTCVYKPYRKTTLGGARRPARVYEI